MGAKVDALVLCGPPARMASVELIGLKGIIAALSAVQGEHAKSSVPDKLTFKKFQANLIKRAGIKEVTGFEWLSRDAEECQKYKDDPLCGEWMSNGWFKAMVHVFSQLNTVEAVPTSSDLPVLVIQGESDTCG